MKQFDYVFYNPDQTLSVGGGSHFSSMQSVAYDHQRELNK